MCIGTPPPLKAMKMPNEFGMEMLNEGRRKNLLKHMLPDAIHEHLYRVHVARDVEYDCDLLLFEFYNGQKVSLRCDAEKGIPVNPDTYEEFMATAVMMSEAGEDVHARPGKSRGSQQMGFNTPGFGQMNSQNNTQGGLSQQGLGLLGGIGNGRARSQS